MPAACRIDTVEFAGDENRSWFGEAVPLYLEYYCRAASGDAGADGTETLIAASVRAWEEKTALHMALSFADGVRSNISLERPAGESASLLAEIGALLLREGVLPPRAPLPSEPPTADREALRYFADALTQDDPGLRRESLARAVGEDGNFFEARWLLAVAEYRNGNWAAALDGFGTVAAGRPDLPAPFMNKALCLFRSGRTGEGAESLEKAAAAKPESRDVALFRGQALSAAGLFEEAGVVFTDILSRNPSEERALFPYALLTARLDGADAGIQALRELSEGGRQRGRDYLYRFGQGAFGRGDLSGAEAAFALAVHADPEHGPSRIGLAAAQYALGKYEEVISGLSPFSKDDGGGPDMFRYLALAHEKLGHTQDAKNNFRRSADLLAMEGVEEHTKSLFLESLAESRSDDGYPPVIKNLYLNPLAGFWRGETSRRVPLPPPEAAVQSGGREDAGAKPQARRGDERTQPEEEGPGAALPPDSTGDMDDQAVRLAREALAAQKALREARKEKESLDAQVEKLQEDNAALKKEVLDRDEALLSLEVMLDEYRRQVDELQSGKATVESAEKEVLEKERLIEELRSKVEALSQELASEREQARLLEEQAGTLSQEAAALREGREKAAAGRTAELEKENTRLEDLLTGFRSDAAAWEKREQELKEDQQEMRKRMSSLEREIGRLEQKLEEGARARREAEKAGEEQAGLAADMEEQVRRGEQEKQSLQHKIKETEGRVDSLEEKVRLGREQVTSLEKKLAESGKDRQVLAGKLEQAQEAGRVLGEQVVELEAALAAAEKRSAEASKRFRKAEKSLAEASSGRGEISEKLKAAEDRAASLEKSESEARKEGKSLGKKLNKAVREIEDLEKEVEKIGGQIAGLRREAEESKRLKKELGSREKELANLRREREEQTDERNDLLRRVKEAEASQGEAARLAEELGVLRKKVEEQRLRLETVEADNGRLRALTERMAEKLREGAIGEMENNGSP